MSYEQMQYPYGAYDQQPVVGPAMVVSPDRAEVEAINRTIENAPKPSATKDGIIGVLTGAGTAAMSFLGAKGIEAHIINSHRAKEAVVDFQKVMQQVKDSGIDLTDHTDLNAALEKTKVLMGLGGNRLQRNIDIFGFNFRGTPEKVLGELGKVREAILEHFPNSVDKTSLENAFNRAGIIGNESFNTFFDNFTSNIKPSDIPNGVTRDAYVTSAYEHFSQNLHKITLLDGKVSDTGTIRQEIQNGLDNISFKEQGDNLKDLAKGAYDAVNKKIGISTMDDKTKYTVMAVAALGAIAGGIYMVSKANEEKKQLEQLKSTARGATNDVLVQADQITMLSDAVLNTQAAVPSSTIQDLEQIYMQPMQHTGRQLTPNGQGVASHAGYTPDPDMQINRAAQFAVPNGTGIAPENFARPADMSRAEMMAARASEAAMMENAR